MPLKPKSDRPVIQPPSQGKSVNPESGSTYSSLSDFLADSDFQLASGPSKRVDCLICGPTGVGKSNFCLRYMPDPIAIIYYDGRSDAAVEEAKQLGRTVVDINLTFNKTNKGKDQLREEARSVIDQTLKNIDKSVKASLNGIINSIVLDGGTEYGEIADVAFDGVDDERKNAQYGKDLSYVDKQFRRLYERIRVGKAHFAITARPKEIYEMNVQTGRKEGSGEYTWRGRESMGESMQWAAYMSVDKKKKSRRNRGAGDEDDFESRLKIKLIKAGRNGSEYGKIYTAEDWEDHGPFAYISWLQNLRLFSDSTPEDWK